MKARLRSAAGAGTLGRSALTLLRPASRDVWTVRRRLARRYLRGEGLEVGALHRPLAVRRGVRVRYVDRHSVDQLRAHYPELRDHDLVPVDVIDDGETLATVPDASVDFVVANHFLEHTQDPIGTLGHHLRVLRRGGILFLAVPDKRRTFDADRPVTPLEHLVRDHAEGPAWSRRTHFEEWAALVERVAPAAVAERARELESYDYSIHFHVWTPTTFTALLAHAAAREQLPLAVEALQSVQEEFVTVLRKDGHGP